MQKRQKDANKRLIQKLQLMGSNDFSDELYAIAYNIEETLINAGAIPGKDYSHIDLIKLAQPFLIELFKKDGRISYTYPADEVAPP